MPVGRKRKAKGGTRNDTEVPSKNHCDESDEELTATSKDFDLEAKATKRSTRSKRGEVDIDSSRNVVPVVSEVPSHGTHSKCDESDEQTANSEYFDMEPTKRSTRSKRGGRSEIDTRSSRNDVPVEPKATKRSTRSKKGGRSSKEELPGGRSSKEELPDGRTSKEELPKEDKTQLHQDERDASSDLPDRNGDKSKTQSETTGRKGSRDMSSTAEGELMNDTATVPTAWVTKRGKKGRDFKVAKLTEELTTDSKGQMEVTQMDHHGEDTSNTMATKTVGKRKLKHGVVMNDPMMSVVDELKVLQQSKERKASRTKRATKPLSRKLLSDGSDDSLSVVPKGSDPEVEDDSDTDSRAFRSTKVKTKSRNGSRNGHFEPECPTVSPQKRRGKRNAEKSDPVPTSDCDDFSADKRRGKRNTEKSDPVPTSDCDDVTADKRRGKGNAEKSDPVPMSDCDDVTADKRRGKGNAEKGNRPTSDCESITTETGLREAIQATTPPPSPSAFQDVEDEKESSIVPQTPDVNLSDLNVPQTPTIDLSNVIPPPMTWELPRTPVCHHHHLPAPLPLWSDVKTSTTSRERSQCTNVHVSGTK